MAGSATTGISRRVQLGPVTRTNRGDTDGDYVAGRVSAAVDLFTAAGVGIGPDVAVQYEKLTIDGYSENGTSSTDVAFGRQRIKGWTGRAGMVARSLPGSAVGFFARADYERNFNDDPRLFTIAPVGAPISYTTKVTKADREYLSYAMGVDGQLIGPLSARAGVSGYALRDGPRQRHRLCRAVDGVLIGCDGGAAGNAVVPPPVRRQRAGSPRDRSATIGKWSDG